MDTPETKLTTQPDKLIEFTTREQNRDLVRDIALCAKQSIQLFSENLDNSLYDNQDFIDAVGKLALRSSRSKIQILVRDTSALVKKGHRLIELARRHSSTIHINNPSEDDRQKIMELMLVDQKGYIHKKHADYYHGEASFNDQRLTREWQRQFSQIWELSSPDPEMRRLNL